MPLDNDIVTSLRTHWQDSAVPDGLADRIIRHARSLPQHQPFALRLAIALRHAFSEWNYALAYKGAALVAVAMLGMLTSQNIATDTSSDMLHLATTSWTEEL